MIPSFRTNDAVFRRQHTRTADYALKAALSPFGGMVRDWHALCHVTPATQTNYPSSSASLSAMFASPYHQVTESSSVRGIVLWILMCFAVFYVIDDLATRPKPIDVEAFRSVGMNDEQVLALALQEANQHREVIWWINDRETYLVFDTTRDYRISNATYAAFDLLPAYDASAKPIAIFAQRTASFSMP